MPYVDPQTRDRLDDPDSPARQRCALNAGELTYQLQQVLLAFIKDHELRYQTLAECLGALEGAKLDLIERCVKPYERKKAEENGDVWPDSLTGEDWRAIFSVGGPITTHAEHPVMKTVRDVLKTELDIASRRKQGEFLSAPTEPEF